MSNSPLLFTALTFTAFIWITKATLVVKVQPDEFRDLRAGSAYLSEKIASKVTQSHTKKHWIEDMMTTSEAESQQQGVEVKPKDLFSIHATQLISRALTLTLTLTLIGGGSKPPHTQRSAIDKSVGSNPLFRSPCHRHRHARCCISTRILWV